MMSIHRSHGRTPHSDDGGLPPPIPSLGELLRQKLAQDDPPQDGERDAADEAVAAICAAASRAGADDVQEVRP
ncbi:hypothetical protein [Variovorax sp. Sphag1AA]|uniref:hypothetical protein n=1 Tax=Variovorax sp. Sphag1AA TaxID=2587027 RepID=UPI001614974C|nr:hypothetical protein [Variovorax sp. Sphag1AA]MBB3180084.1 hypothetical protein [Variovorax sp. Sphag1AA]